MRRREIPRRDRRARRWAASSPTGGGCCRRLRQRLAVHALGFLGEPLDEARAIGDLAAPSAKACPARRSSSGPGLRYWRSAGQTTCAARCCARCRSCRAGAASALLAAAMACAASVRVRLATSTSLRPVAGSFTSKRLAPAIPSPAISASVLSRVGSFSSAREMSSCPWCRVVSKEMSSRCKHPVSAERYARKHAEHFVKQIGPEQRGVSARVVRRADLYQVGAHHVQPAAAAHDLQRLRPGKATDLRRAGATARTRDRCRRCRS